MGCKIVVVSGLPGSGKSTYCKLMASFYLFHHFDLDRILDKLWDKQERLRYLKEHGISKLEEEAYRMLRKWVTCRLKYMIGVVYIDGIKADKVFGDIADYHVEMKIDEETRLARLRMREGSDARVEFIESLRNNG